MGYGIKREFRTFRRLIRVINSRETFDPPGPRLGIDSLDVPFFATLQWRIHEDFHKMAFRHHVPRLFARRSIRADGGANHHAAMSYDLRGDYSDPPDVSITVLFAEPESFRKMDPY